jgi:hypothetical protein
MSSERLNDIAVELTGLCAEIQKAAPLTEDERKSLSNRAECVMEDLENEYGIPAFRPEVTAETQKMFFTLQKFVTEG